jgi:hypothetical protein
MDDDLDAEFPVGPPPLGAIAGWIRTASTSRLSQLMRFRLRVLLAEPFRSSASLLISRSSRSPRSSWSWRPTCGAGSVPISNTWATWRLCGRLRTDTAVVSTAHHRAVSTDFGEPARF